LFLSLSIHFDLINRLNYYEKVCFKNINRFFLFLSIDILLKGHYFIGKNKFLNHLFIYKIFNQDRTISALCLSKNKVFVLETKLNWLSYDGIRVIVRTFT
jgi:hypothetical protein